MSAPAVVASLNAASGALSYSAPVTAPVAARTTLAAVVTGAAADAVLLTDSQGGTWYAALNGSGVGPDVTVWVCRRSPGLGTSDKITATFPGTSSAVNILAVALPGSYDVDSAAAATSIASGTSGTVQSASTGTLRAAGEIVLAFEGVSTVAPAWQAPLTALSPLLSGSGAGFAQAAWVAASGTGPVSVSSSTASSAPSWTVAALPFTPAFPGAPLDLRCELNLANEWTDVSSFVYQRDGTQAPVTLQRGRPDEASSANPSSATFEVDNRDGRFTPKLPASPYYGLLGRNTPVRFSVPAAVNYLRLEADNMSAATCPTSAALNITGDIDIRVDMDFSGYQLDFNGNPHGDLITKYTADGSSQNSWFFEFAENGLRFGWNDSGGHLQVGASALAPPARGRQCYRVTLQVATGTLTFFTGPAGGCTGSAWTQLGPAQLPTSGAATTIFASTADLSVGNHTSAGLAAAGANGAYFEAALYSGISGTLVAHPVFSAQAAGTPAWNDGLGNAWALAGTAQISDRDYRYHGELSSIPPRWDSSGNDMAVPVQAGGELRRLGQGQAPLQSPMKRALLAQSGTLAVRQYWPGEDMQGATAIGSATGGPLMSLNGGTGDGTITTTGPAFAADSSFLCSAALPTVNGSTWVGKVPHYSGSGAIVARFLMKLGTLPSSGTPPLVRLITTGTCMEVSMHVYTGGALGIAGFDSGGNVVFDTGPVAFAAGGKALWVSMELRPNGGSSAHDLVVLVPGASTGLAIGLTNYSGQIGNVTAVYVDPSGFFTDSVVGHISVQSDWESMFALFAPLNAWQGEPAGQRFARLCGENGLQARVVGPPATTALMGAQPVDTLMALLQQCEDADRGQIFEPRRCIGLGYRTLASMSAQAAAVTLDYSLSQPGGVSGGTDSGLEPTYDDQYTRNDVTAQRSSGSVSGASFQYQLDDGSAMSVSPPPAGVGDYSNSISLNVQSDAQLPDEAGWMVHIGTVDEARWPAIPLNLARPALAGLYYALLGTDIGDYVALRKLPGQITPDPVRQLAWQLKESLGGFHHTLEPTCVPESPYEVAIFDDPVYGRADTDGSALASPASAGQAATVWQVAADWASWNATQAALSVSGDQLVITSQAGTGGFWQGFGPQIPLLAGQTVAVAALFTPQQALGSAGIGVHIGGGSDTFTSNRIAVTAGQKVLLVVSATAAAGQTYWQPFCVDQENSPAGFTMTVSKVWGGIVSTLSVATTDSTTPLWTVSSADFPFDVAIAGERITVVSVTGSSSPQAFTVIRSVNGVSKSQQPSADVRLWTPPVYAMT